MLNGFLTDSSEVACFMVRLMSGTGARPFKPFLFDHFEVMRRRHRGGLAVFVHRANEHGVVAGFLGFPLERPPYPTDRIRSLGVVAPPRFPAIQGNSTATMRLS